MNPPAPLSFTTSPRLDAALARGSTDWLAAARAMGADATLRWMSQRADLAEQVEDVEMVLRPLLEATDADDTIELQAELAELLTGDDDMLAEVLVEGVLAYGYEVGDAEIIVDAVSHLAELAEDAGDLLTAAEHHIDFLNWRRRPGSSSDPDWVSAAFEEVVRLAESDGAAQVAAMFGYRQVAFQRIADRDAEPATSGDWDPTAPPYQSWA